MSFGYVVVRLCVVQRIVVWPNVVRRNVVRPIVGVSKKIMYPAKWTSFLFIFWMKILPSLLTENPASSLSEWKSCLLTDWKNGCLLIICMKILPPHCLTENPASSLSDWKSWLLTVWLKSLLPPDSLIDNPASSLSEWKSLLPPDSLIDNPASSLSELKPCLLTCRNKNPASSLSEWKSCLLTVWMKILPLHGLSSGLLWPYTYLRPGGWVSVGEDLSWRMVRVSWPL